jgi:hypothetical protein
MIASTRSFVSLKSNLASIAFISIVLQGRCVYLMDISVSSIVEVIVYLYMYNV